MTLCYRLEKLFAPLVSFYWRVRLRRYRIAFRDRLMQSIADEQAMEARNIEAQVRAAQR